MNQLLLVDADILVYKIAFSVETPIYVCKGGIYTRKGYAEKMSKENGYPVVKRVNIGSEQELRAKLNKLLCTIYDDLGSHNHKFFITSSKVEGNFRSQIATLLPYKGNRTQSVKPFHYNKIRHILVNEYGAELVKGQEADDAIAIEQTRLFNINKNYEHSIIVSIDKDLLTVPGYHYNINRRTIEFVDEEMAKKNFYQQLLVGDAVDNIPGIVKLLKNNNRVEESNKLAYGHYIKKYRDMAIDRKAEECYNYVLEIYEKHGFGKKEIFEIGNLLHLRRYEGQIWSEDIKTI